MAAGAARGRIQYRALDSIRPYESNPRRNDGAVQAVASSIREFGFRSPIVVDADGTIIAGHTRYKAAHALGLSEVPVLVADDLTPEQCAAYRLADNKTGELAEWDAELLAVELDGLVDIDMSAFGFDGASLPDISDLEQFKQDEKSPAPSLSDRFGVPPFSVLDARSGRWAERKRAWLALGIKSELGRGGGRFTAAPGGSALPLNRG